MTLADGPMNLIVFRKETVARVDRFGTGDFRGGDDPVRFQIAFLARCRSDADRLIGELDVHGIDIRLGIDGDRFDSEFAAGADDAKGDFTAVGDQDAFEHGRKWRVIGEQ
jgi:hypothetical protein